MSIGAKLQKCLTIAISIIILFSGCSGGDLSHDPGPGLAGLIVDNITPDDIDVLVDGIKVLHVEDFDDESTDVTPGVRRILLISADGKNSFGEDVDFLVGRSTILTVKLDGDGSGYNVDVSFDD